MAVGRDAADVAITTSFGSTRLTKFDVITDEVPANVAKEATEETQTASHA